MYYDRFDVSEGIDVNKTDSSYECKIYHCNYFFTLNFSFHPNPCHGCHDLLQKATSLIKLQLFSIKGNAYRIHIWSLSKNEAIRMMKKSFNINSN